MRRPGPFLRRCRERYGDSFTVRIANEGDWVIVSHPDAIREVFTGDPHVLHAGEGNRILRPLLGPRSVLVLDDEPHLRQRKLLLPPFHGDRMRSYARTIEDVATREVTSWPAGEPLRLAPRMQALTLEVILRTIFGVEEAGRLRRLGDALRRMLDWTTDPPRMAALLTLGPDRFERLGIIRRAMDPVDALLGEEIADARRDPRLGEREDVLAMLAAARHDDGSPMTDAEIRDELLTLLVAGHETTATALSWAMERLLRHPAAWERLRAEAATDDDVYADAVVKETLRLRPVLNVVVRRLTRDHEIAGMRLPAGAAVVPCIWLAHRREDVYADPHAFRPERFLEQPAGTYTWLPFGGGVRRCLGASFALFEMKRVLRVIARHVDLRASGPAFERTTRRSITLVPARGAEVVVAPVVQGPATAPAARSAAISPGV
jgi:cytochrome P450